MTSYYAVPVWREVRTLHYNPFDGRCALAATPHDAALQLGVPDVGSMFAVWPLNRKVNLEEAARICSAVAPYRIFIMIDPAENVFFPLGLDPMLDAIVEVHGAGRD